MNLFKTHNHNVSFIWNQNILILVINMVLSTQDILDDTTYKRFLEKKRSMRESTQRQYLPTIRCFCNFVRMTPTEIHDKCKSELREKVPEFDQWLPEALEKYVNYLIDNKREKSTIQKHISRIKTFLHTFRIKPTPKIEISVKEEEKHPRDALTVEDIRTALDNSTPTYKAIFITQAQTGLAISDTLLLNVDNFIKAVTPEKEELTLKQAINLVKKEAIVGCIDWRRLKTSNIFYTFIGPEALRSIASLLEKRSEKYNTRDSPIFIRKNDHLPDKYKKHKYTMEEMRLNPNTVEQYTIRMNRDRKLFPIQKKNGKNRYHFRTHKLRSWFSNQLRYKAGFNSEDTKYLMGQKTGDVFERYADPNNYNALKANYRKALPYLAINDEIKIEENQEAIESLNHELQEYKEKYKEESKARDEEMSDMQSEIINLKKLLNSEDFAKDRI
jgi:integrase